MRVKQAKLVVSFETTADALYAEQVFQKQGLQGRLIPTPREISAGCGLAWAETLEAEFKLKALVQQHAIAIQKIQTVLL